MENFKMKNQLRDQLTAQGCEFNSVGKTLANDMLDHVSGGDAFLRFLRFRRVIIIIAQDM